MTYVKVRSWHVLKTWSRMPGVGVTLCGRRTGQETRDTLPAEATCESCLRIEKSERYTAVAEPDADRITL